MGLIKKHGTHLVGKIFLYQGQCQHNSVELAWCIGRILRLRNGQSVIYKSLLRSKNLVASPNSFQVNSPIDFESKLIKGSLQFEKYLKLWD